MAGITTFGDVFNSALGFGSSVNNVFQDMSQEKARRDIEHMKAQLNSDTNNFLLELEQETDYSKFPEKLDTFFSQKRNLMRQKPANGESNPYYAANSYTADLAESMFNDQYAALQNKITFLSLGKMQNEMYAQSQDTKSIIRNDPGLNWLTKIQEITQLTSEDYATGTMIKDQTTYEATARKEAGDIYAENLINTGKNLINNNASWDEIKQMLESTEENFSLKVLSQGTNKKDLFEGNVSYKELSFSDNAKNIKKEAEKQLKSDFEAHRNELWKNNESGLNKLYTSMAMSESPEERLRIAKKGLATVSAYEPNSDLSNEKHKFWTDQFDSEIKAIAKGKTGSGSGSSSLPSFEKYIEEYPETFIEKVKDGTYRDYYQATQALTNVFLKDYNSQDWKETAGMSASEKAEYFEKSYSQRATAKILNDKQIREILKAPELQSISNKFDAFTKSYTQDLSKKPKERKYSDEAAGYIASLVYDIAASSGKNADYKQLAKLLDTNLNAVELTKLEKLFKGSENIAKGTRVLQENDLVHTDIHGAEQWAPGVKEKADAIAEKQGEMLSSILGVPIGKDDWSYKKVSNDTLPVPVFTVDGNEYEFKVDPKDKNNYIIVDNNGNVINPKQMDKEKKKQTRKQVVEAAKQTTRVMREDEKKQAELYSRNTIK